jgi:hypothetical protein
VNQSALAEGFEEFWLADVDPAHLAKDMEIALAKPREAIEFLRCDLGLVPTPHSHPGRGPAPIPEPVFPPAIVQVAVV